jgi:hypothetical protein
MVFTIPIPFPSSSSRLGCASVCGRDCISKNMQVNSRPRGLVNRTGLLIYCHILWSGYRWSFGFDIGCIDHLSIRFGSTSNYSAVANHHNSQITRPHSVSFAACVSSAAVPWQRLLTVEILQLHALQVLSERLQPSNCLVPSHIPVQN